MALLWAAGPAEAFTSYHVGNSLTWDSRPQWMDDFAVQKVVGDHTVGYHVECGKSLPYIWDHPDSSCVAPVPQFGLYAEALPAHEWDALTLQPFNGGGATLAVDTARILDFLNLARTNPANGDTAVYLLGAWPAKTGFSDTWLAEVPDADNTPAQRARQYYDHLLNRVRASTDAEVYLIPSGAVLFELDARMKRGEVPGFDSVADLYRDNLHLTTDVGRFVAAATMFATLHRTTPHGLVHPNFTDLTDPDNPFSSELYESLYDAIWDVVTSTVLTGVLTPGDFDRDGDVDAFDLGVWQGGFGTAEGTTAADGDADGDGDVDAFDLGLWQANFGSGAAAAPSTVPEPTTAALLMLAGGTALRRNRR